MSGPIPMSIPPGIRQQLGTMPDRCLAEQLGVSLSTIARWRIALGIPAHARHETTARYLILLAAHSNGLLTVQIARTLGVSRQAVHQVLQRLAHEGHITSETQMPTTQFTRPPIRWRIHAGERTT